MKFVGHCTSVLKCFTSNFKGILSTPERMNTSETIALQQQTLSLPFILDHLLICDIMHAHAHVRASAAKNQKYPYKVVSLDRVVCVAWIQIPFFVSNINGSPDILDVSKYQTQTSNLQTRIELAIIPLCLEINLDFFLQTGR